MIERSCFTVLFVLATIRAQTLNVANDRRPPTAIRMIVAIGRHSQRRTY